MNLSMPLVTQLMRTHGDALYILNSSLFAQNFVEMLTAFRKVYPETHIAYSYKTNYIPSLCRKIHQLGGFAEVVSEMEYELAVRIGVSPTDIYYNGPYKKEPFLREALLNGVNVNLDSLAEVRMATALARAHTDRSVAVGLRCNFEIDAEGVSRFGLDCEGEEFAQALEMIKQEKNLIITGIHCHFPTRQLDSFHARAAGMTSLLRRLSLPELRYVSFGGGYFGKVPPDFATVLGFSPPTYADYAAIVGKAMHDIFGPSDDVRLIIEPGSAIVADAMSLAARVVSIKTVRGRHIATLAASSYNVNPSAKGIRRPMDVFRDETHNASGNGANKPMKTWNIVGYTCIEDDCLYTGYEGHLAEDDIVVFHNVGSYSVVFKPPFILPNVPVIDIADGAYKVVKRAETFDDIFSTFNADACTKRQQYQTK